MRVKVGIAMMVAAVVIAPAAHFWSSIGWAASAALAFTGIVLYASERVTRRELKDRANPNGNAGDATVHAPGPLHPGGVRRGSAGGDDVDGDFDGDFDSD
jgi:hypothetical protein